MTTGLDTVGIEGVGGDAVHSPPSCTVTGPTATVTTTSVTATWSYSSVISRAQAAYRVLLRSADGTVTFYDSGIVPGAGTSSPIPFLLSGGSMYMVAVSAFDGIDWSAEATSLFPVEIADVNDYPDNKDVGSVYEVGINGVGYMLADHPDKDTRYQRRVVPLDAPRLATGETPFSQAIDRYTLIGETDWSSGAGQRYYDREGSTPSAYFRSFGINPFEPGQLTLLNDTSQFKSSAYATQLAVVAGNKLYVCTANGQLTERDDPSDVTDTTFTITGAAAPLAMTSDGTNWYYADGANVYRNSSAADPGSAWSSVDAELIEWCGDRIVIARKGVGSSTPNEVVVLSDAGAVVGAAQTFTLPVGSTVTSITSGDGYIWWSATRNDESAIFGWRITTETTSYFTATEMPQNQAAQSIFFYLGNLMVRSAETTGTSQKKAVIYRGTTSEGIVSLGRVLELTDASVDHGPGAWAGDDRFLYFSWRQMNTVSGIGCIDLSTGGYATWLQAPSSATGRVRSLLQWYGRAVFTVDGYGVVLESTNPIATGFLDTSLTDLNTGLRKVFSSVRVTFDPLPSSGSVVVSYSLDNGATFVPIGTASTAGSKAAVFDVDQESDNVKLRIALGASATSPTFRTLVMRAHPVGLSDQVLQLAVNCADNCSGLNGAPLAENAPGAGARRARALEALAQTRVRLQDVDWKITNSAQVYEIISTEVSSVGVYSAAAQRQVQAQVCVLTLRRSFT